MPKNQQLNVCSWHKTDRQSPHSSISPPHSTPQQRWRETAPCVAVGVNPQSGNNNHRHNANAWPPPTSETHSFI